jgi:hypothetical protein
MASEVQRDLDGARRELRRGVLELPQETSEAANAMRRVVSDQIKALKELAAVVSASGASFDVAEPAPPTAPTLRSEPIAPPRPAPREDEAPRYVATARPAAPPREEEPARPARPAAPARAIIVDPQPIEDALRDLTPPPRVVAPARETYVGQDTMPAPYEPARPRALAPPAPPPPPPLPPMAPTGERGQSGWLSNLLAAASRDEQAPAPRPPSPVAGGTLESISLDIARLVDTDAASEMWERWRAGDTTAVSRRLYTAPGQQTFEDLRRRYRSDPGFRDSVDRYVKEFERLLAKIGQNDRDGSQSRVAMLSDSGKVYVMLAHASGRLG